MKRRTALVLAAALAVSVVMLAQGARRDGKWDVTMEMDMPGMPMKMPPMTTTKCVTKDQVDDPSKMFPQQGPGGRGRGNNDCKVTDQKIEGNKVTWAMTCAGQQPMTAVGEMIYGEDTYNGTVKMDVTGRGTMTMKYVGKRVGDCDQ